MWWWRRREAAGANDCSALQQKGQAANILGVDDEAKGFCQLFWWFETVAADMRSGERIACHAWQLLLRHRIAPTHWAALHRNAIVPHCAALYYNALQQCHMRCSFSSASQCTASHSTALQSCLHYIALTKIPKTHHFIMMTKYRGFANKYLKFR